VLFLSPTSADNLDLQYRYFHLGFPRNQEYDPNQKDYVTSIYQRLLRNFANKGYNDSYELLDIEYKEWQESDNWTLYASDLWWKFGYRKSKILWWTLGIIFFFSILNRWRFSELQHAYPVDNLKDEFYEYPVKSNWFVRAVKKYIISILYTGLIFFKLSVDFHKMKFDRLGYSLIILFQYTIGLICTGFLINWILKG
jgi:hypothetical protein